MLSWFFGMDMESQGMAAFLGWLGDLVEVVSRPVQALNCVLMILFSGSACRHCREATLNGRQFL